MRTFRVRVEVVEELPERYADHVTVEVVVHADNDLAAVTEVDAAIDRAASAAASAGNHYDRPGA